jgi:hypothetical protein
MRSLGNRDAFYARSLDVDELGTAGALLEWRDALVEGGWDGCDIRGGGPRLEALAAIERCEGEPLPLGPADRLARVERALRSASAARMYGHISSLEGPTLWPGRWRRIFDLLEKGGTPFTRATLDLPGAWPRSDLGILQARLRGEKTNARLRGDGSFLVLRGNTSTDLAELAASVLARGRAAGSTDVVVRCRDPQPLETALAKYGLPLQGCTNRSVWRPAMQVLPLAVELAFHPRDPNRLLELLTLPVGPFRGIVGARLARAVARQPGIGGKEWRLQKEEARARLFERQRRREQARGRSASEADCAANAVVDERIAMVDAWLEAPSTTDGVISRSALLAVVARVRAWVGARLGGDERETYFAAHAQAVTFESAVANDRRDLLTREEVRQLLDRYGRSEQAHDVTVDTAGRVAHVDHPAGILGSCDRVMLWSFIGGVERRPPRSPWSEDERCALAAAGVELADSTALLAAEADAWRRSILAACERVVLVAPRTIEATPTVNHPLWDEIRARLALDDEGSARITHDVSRIIDGSMRSRLAPVIGHAPLRLPEGRGEWRVPGELVRDAAPTTSVSALESIATCPLAWVFEHRAVLRSGALSKVANGTLLNGILGHRLVEMLHGEGAFDVPEDAFVEHASERFEELLRTEGATLLLPGASIERLQLKRQIRRAMRELHRYLARTERHIRSVEEVITADSAVGSLHGRLDLHLVDRHGRDRDAIVDLKWGVSRYRDALVNGRAVQLAVYSRACGSVPAGYFSLATGQVLATDDRMAPARVLDGPSLETTWTRAEATASAVRAQVERGVLHVVGTKSSVPLLDALEVREGERHHHFEASRDDACKHCAYDGLCGRKWEALT